MRSAHGECSSHFHLQPVDNIHQSWDPRNLFNLWQRCFGHGRIDFSRPKETLFQQRWTAKRLIRGYHGDYINEKIFKRYYLPDTLPDVRPRKRAIGDDKSELAAFALRTEQLEKEEKKEKERDKKGLAPVGSLMLAEIERRIDVFLFRCCFAPSVYEARRYVIHGHVLLNGKKVCVEPVSWALAQATLIQHQNANTRLAPGDMVSVDPKAIAFLREGAYTERAPAGESSETIDDGQELVPEQPQLSQAEGQDAAPDKEPRPSKYGEKVEARAAKLHSQKKLTPFNLPPYASPFLFIPPYIEPSFSTCSAIYVRHPTARPGYSEIPTPWDADGEIVRLAWEWYARVRPRMRSKSQLARTPENRREAPRRLAALGYEFE